MRNLFEFQDYREFLSNFLQSSKKGAKLRLSQVLECQPGYLSQILSGASELSAEQAQRFTSFLGFDASMTHYFLLLVFHARAGTKSLRDHYQSQIETLRSQSQVLKNRLKPDKILAIEDQATFYSSWHYGAMHVCVSIPGCETEAGIASYFNLPLKRVYEVVQFLVRVGLVQRQVEGNLQIGSSQVFVGTDSPLISKHHTNWRFRAVDSFDRYKDSHLHYSSVISVAHSDVEKIREIMAQAIQKIRAVVRESKDECCYSYCLDLFEVGAK